jgi:hypothetical protein
MASSFAIASEDRDGRWRGAYWNADDANYLWYSPLSAGLPDTSKTLNFKF